ncbi:DNA lyase-like protein [Elsinoe australis]|uniref:Apurinic-apyrimidinic endonuclease 1 n=1 Tax=Elsinoe australis TaxID=40998 RepID=A0A4U7AXX3_9PEZI|nr:DNA lyase-like protein [Elsinoe australis]
MPRKVVKRAARDVSSDLSPPPNELSEPIEPQVSTPKGKKRKRANGTEAATTTSAKIITEFESTEAVNGTTQVTKKKVKAEQPNGSTIKLEEATVSTPRSARKRKAVKYTEEEEEERKDDIKPASAEATTATPPSKKKKQTKSQTQQPKPTTTPASPGPEDDVPKPKKKRKTAAEKEAAMIPLAARTANPAYHIGAHVSAAGGVHNAVTAAHHIGGNAFALFLKSQRKWANPALSAEVATQFSAACKTHDYASATHVVPHGSYLVNLAHTDPERTKQAYEAFVDDLKRCETLGIGLYNFHPGNVQGGSRQEALSHLAGNLNRAHKETAGVVTLLENMAATGGNVIGCRFEELGEVIKLVEDKERVGVCLDTCHAFAAGYDVRSKEGVKGVLDELEKTVGLKYLRALHMNDSKAPLGSARDLHANIGTGFIGLKGFHAIMNEERLRGLPMVLETPLENYDEEGNRVKDEKGMGSEELKGIWATEIKLLESLTSMDMESEEFRVLEARLSRRGQKERARIQDQVDRREEKASKPKRGKKGSKKKDIEGSASDEGSD